MERRPGPVLSWRDGDPDRLLASAALSFLITVIAGPSVLSVVGRALSRSRRAGLRRRHGAPPHPRP
ncbi:hypothetical protein [Streptomyces sp. MA25(2023)]|uniref:hypothetical protein n=1 Tax=Streptomyces sp. MA25(2023) TaxID=3055078 RepID=UPI0025B1AE63|nr:hypothetical protein [Streptomyces sp. MA25(2023)]